MSLRSGDRLGPYEVVALIGAGGMGQVYRARDSKLNRDVAVKVLPDGVAADPDRLARFEREAQALAALSHPNIAAVYAVEGRAIVMEFVAGEDLGARIKRGPIAIEEALPLARQMTEAIAAAHESGIIHRDLKPANIKVKDDGTIKVLDFGLAKALDPSAGATSQSAELANSPTITARATQLGVILGTAAYMAPEQAKGKVVDKRADIWAFGVVLFEMLTGRRPFAADDVSDTLAHVLTKDPDWSALPATTPSRIRELLRRCLTKDPRQRLHDIADARLEIDDALRQPAEPQPTTPAPRASARRERLMWTAAVAVLSIALVALGASSYLRRGTAEPSSAGIIRSIIGVAPAEQLQPGGPMEGRPIRTAMALSPDGRSLVFSAVRGDQRQLYLRGFDRLDAVPIAGTDGGESPFFSPDGKWIGFWANNALKKIAVGGGAVTMICDTDAIFGASWGADDTIVYATWHDALQLVPSSGGRPQALTTLDSKAGEYGHRLPQFLPDGKSVLFTSVNHFLPDWRDARLWVVSRSTGERHELGQGADARYASSGHLVFMRSGALVAAPFDLATQKLGNALTIVEDVMQSVNTPSGNVETGAGQFALSAAGSLVYVPGGIFPSAERSIVAVDRKGGIVETLPVPPRPYLAPLLSPDESQLVVWTQGTDRNVFTYDIKRGTLTPLTTIGRNSRAIWTPDGQRITFAGPSGGADNLFWIPADRSGGTERLTTSQQTQFPSSWFGRTLAYVETAAPSTDIFTVSLDGDRQPKPFLQTRASEAYPEFSPDGRYLAYTSDESGRDEVYVQPYPGPGPRKQISSEGGAQPKWSRDGHTLYFTARKGSIIRMMALSITLTPSFTAGTPSELFEGPYGGQSVTRGYDVTADGQRFYFTPQKERPPIRVTQMILVQNWFEELRQKLPPRR